MGSILAHTQCVLRFTNQPKFRNSIFSPINLAEIADVPSSVEAKDVSLTVSCIGFDGSRRDRHIQRSSARSGRETSEDEEDERVRPNAPSQEDLISLFRRIQSSISKEERVDNSQVSDKKSSAFSILKVLGESEKKKQGIADGNTSTMKRLVKDKVNSNSTLRPPSNFVRRSPIPSLTTPREISLELQNDVSQTSVKATELGRARLLDMKLTQLKELAKSRGLKGYSKLKKSELVNLLNS